MSERQTLSGVGCGSARAARVGSGFSPVPVGCSSKYPTFLNEFQDPARDFLGGAESLAEGDHSSIVIDSQRRSHIFIISGG